MIQNIAYLLEKDEWMKKDYSKGIENKAAWKLYEKLGFVNKPRPAFLEPLATYLLMKFIVNGM